MDTLKELQDSGYRPYSFADFMLVEIYKKLCEIADSKATVNSNKTERAKTEDNKTENVEKEPEGKKKVEAKSTNKVCSYCGEVHDKPVDYANCAKKHKKEGDSK